MSSRFDISVEFMFFYGSFSATFPKDCGRVEGLGTLTCLRTVVGCRQGHAACRIVLLQQSLGAFTFRAVNRTVAK